MSLPPALGAVIRAHGGPALPPPGITFGPVQERVRSPSAALCLSISAGKGAGDHQILPVPGEARRLGVGAELCDHRAQQPLVQAALYRQRQLCPHVSASLGPLCPLQATLVSTRVQVVGTAGLGETGVCGGRRC